MTSERQTMSETECAICGDTPSSTELYPAAIAADGTLKRGRIVRCDRCGLRRTDPIADGSFTRRRQTAALRPAYRRALERVLQLGAGMGALLEIGADGGAFQDEARAAGFERVTGVAGTLRTGSFSDATFDVVCLPSVLDRVADPRACLYASLDVLKPGGYLLATTDNVDGVFTRLFGRHSPIFDAAHTFFYDPETLATLVRRIGLDVVSARPIASGHVQIIARKPGRATRL
jgi:SAM-dependent methyltransferase